MNVRRLALFCITSATFLNISAHATICDAHYLFDGSLEDASGNGYHGQMIAAGGEPSIPNFVPGRRGQALKLDGTNAMRAFLDLHPDNCPQMTVAAWVQIEPEPNQMIFGNDGGNRLFTSGASLGVRTTHKDLWADVRPIRANAGWLFIAAVWDYANQFQRVHWRTRHNQASFAGRKPKIGDPAIWIGADNDRLHYHAKNITIDEIQFIGRALSPAEVLELRRSGLASRAAAPVNPGSGQRESRTTDTLPAAESRRPLPDQPISDTIGTGPAPASDTKTETGRTLADMQAQAAARNADAVGSVDQTSPTDVLPDNPPSDPTTLSEMQAQSAAANADIARIDRDSPEDVLPDADPGQTTTDPGTPTEQDAPTGPNAGGAHGDMGGMVVRDYLYWAKPAQAPSGDIALCKPFDQRIPALAMGFRDEIVDLATTAGCDLMNQSVALTATGSRVQSPTEYRTVSFQSDLLREAYSVCLGRNAPSASIPSGLTAFWNNNVANNGWGTIGPRHLKFNEQVQGNLVAPGDRKFITLHPWLDRRRPAVMDLQETGGKARVYVTICSIEPWTNHYDHVHAFSMNDTDDERDNENQTVIHTLSNDLKFYSIDLDSRGLPTRHFSYTLKLGY